MHCHISHRHALQEPNDIHNTGYKYRRRDKRIEYCKQAFTMKLMFVNLDISHSKCERKQQVSKQ